ncbi:NepR family anti-sigma factor [Qipengyuania oceanensis]|uniref:Anti-sigma factor NepR domain-containing protein n=1 Tax=Qipengyuania oceanensis TaxID=1463597 RepID=A0A844YKD6_9SPHN|nr:NepR family anti-sigma factor [Qipengyuania oceanensis]MXO63965.1 hypothetical protein [Qipengyuania oceanensis]
MNGETEGRDEKAGRVQKHSKNGSEKPGWANGLRQLYDTVVNEPLPDNFKDLLSKLDDQD